MVHRLGRAVLSWCIPALCIIAQSASAQTWRIGAVNSVLQIPATNACNVTWYDPEVFVPSTGTVKLLTQGGNLSQVCNPVGTPGIDSFFSAQGSSSTGAWTTPTATSCPGVRGFYMQGGQTQNCGYSPTNPGPIASPSVVKIGTHFFMAFSGGNADYIMGRIYWAVSSDGTNWTAFNNNPPAGFTWKPILTPEYGNPCSPFGVGQLSLSYDAADTSMGPNGTFYIHIAYIHGTAGKELDVYAYRFAYNPSDAAGFGLPSTYYSNGTKPGQFCVAASSSPTATCSWVNHSGRVVFDYDNQPVAVAGDPLITRYTGMRQLQYGGGDIKFDPIHNNWLHLYSFGGSVSWQTATSLASSTWTSAQTVDLSGLDSALTSRYGGNYQSSERYYGGLWYGALGNRTGLWLFQPVDPNNCSWPFAGLGIAPAELCSGTPTVTIVSPATGPASGGTAITLSGTNLDCASAVTFGGTAASVVSKSPTSLSVTTPAHAASAVNVAVTTPGGTATKTNGFTYTAPPVYEGFHDSLDCNGTAGWAWDQNRPNDPITVDIYDGTTLLGSVSANGFRQDLLNAGKGNGYHGFGFSLPSSVRNGSAHSISVKFGGTSTLLTSSPRSVTCRSLSVTKAGTGAGTVTSNPAGISCGSDCSEWYPANSSVTLTASATSGTFSGWSGAADCSDGVVTLSANLSCTATFTAPTPTARLIWLQPQAKAGFGTPGSLVMAGSASGAAAGTTVRVTWRDVTANGAWTTEPYQAPPDGNGIWYHEILNANYTHQYAVYATYSTVTSTTCTYPGSGTIYWCP